MKRGFFSDKLIRMVFFKKKFIKLSKSRGQATMEYILLIAVVVAIFVVFKKYGEGLMGFSARMVGPDGYYGCLLKKGQLPGNPCGSQNLDPQALFDQHVSGALSSYDSSQQGPGSRSGPGSQPGSLNGGPNSSTDSGENAFSSANSSSAGNNSRNRRSHRHKIGKARSLSSKSKVGGEGSGGSTDGESASSDDGSFAGSSSFPAISSDEKRRAKRKKKRKKRSRARRGDGNIAGGFKKKKKQRRASARFPVARGEGYLGDQFYEEDMEEREDKGFKGGTTSQKKGSDGIEEKQDKQLISDKKASATNQGLKDDEYGFKFNKFLKYLVIAAMIIAVIIVVFSQIMEYQSRD